MATQTAAKRAPKQPQDKLPAKQTAFKFQVGEKEFTLPFVDQEILNGVDGGIVEAALLDGEEGQAKMAFALLRAVPGHDDVKAALRALPFPEMLGTLLAWLEAGGAALGKSQG